MISLVRDFEIGKGGRGLAAREMIIGNTGKQGANGAPRIN
jgi:hypothetical protein